VPSSWTPVPARIQLAVDAFEDLSVVLENARVTIQSLHDRQPDGVDVLERFLGRSRVTGGVPSKFAHHFLEPCVRPEPLSSPLFVGLEPFLAAFRISLSSLSVGLLSIGSHFDAKVAKLCQDRLDPGIEVSLVLSVGHGHNLSPRAPDFNVSIQIR
jgi:hypothetical protein